MFRSTGAFADLMCPDPQCSRPNCMFWHNTEVGAADVASTSSSHVQEEAPLSPQYDPCYPANFSSHMQNIAAARAANVSSFSGYTGYVDANEPQPSTISMYAPVEPPMAVGGYTGYVASIPAAIPQPLPVQPVISQEITGTVPATTSSPVPMAAEPPASSVGVLVKKEINDEEDDVMIIKEKKAKPSILTKCKTEPLDGLTSQTGKRIKSLPLPKSVVSAAAPPKSKTKQLLEAADDVAKIDAEIERLMNLRNKCKKKTGSVDTVTDGQEPAATIADDSTTTRPAEYVPDEPAPVPVRPAPVSVIGYTPTPLAALKKQKEEEQRLREEKMRERERKREERRAEEEKMKKKPPVSVDALFGDDSSDDDCVPVPKKARIERDNSPSVEVLSSKSKAKVFLAEKAASGSKMKVTLLSKPAKDGPSLVGRASSSKGVSNGDGGEKVERGKGLTAEQIAAARQRVARPAAGSIVRPVESRRRLPNTTEQLQKRMTAIAQAREAAAAKAKLEAGNNPKMVSQEQMYGRRRPGTAGTVEKGEARSSRLAQAASTTGKPQLREPTNPKISMAVRLPYLNRIFTQLAEFLPRHEAIEQAEEEEKAVLDRINHKQGYMVAVVNVIKRIRDAADGKPKTSAQSKVSHGILLAGRGHDQITIGANGPKRSLPLTELRLHEALVAGYLLTPEQMAKNSYPRYVSENRVYIEPSPYDKKKNRKTFVPDYELDRICSRCSKEFTLSPKGLVTSDTCIYHLKGKGRKPGKPRVYESTHPCCGGDGSVAGCQVATSHVTDTLRESDLGKFVEAPPARKNDPRSKKVLAMDCEMIYTVWGPALARVTVVDINEQVVLDEIVKPHHTVVDYNTNFSGITANELETATCTLESAQERLFELINRESILIGHSLESDLKAMRMVHNKIVDTAVLFPHRTDNDKKRGLKELSMDKLNKSIQDDIGGHDSKEDSVAALQLVLYKLKFDGKL